MPKLVSAYYTEGLIAYHKGLSISTMIVTLEAIKAKHQQPGLTNEQHEDIENAGPSLIAGFADGLIEDIRHIASSRRGQTA